MPSTTSGCGEENARRGQKYGLTMPTLQAAFVSCRFTSVGAMARSRRPIELVLFRSETGAEVESTSLARRPGRTDWEDISWYESNFR